MSTDDNKSTGTTPLNDNLKPMPPAKKKIFGFKLATVFKVAAGGTLVAAAIGYEFAASPLENHIYTKVAKGEWGTKKVTTTPEAKSPRDKTLGYADLDKDSAALAAANYKVSAQEPYLEHSVFGMKLYPIDTPKLQTGFALVDTHDQPLYQAAYPRQAFTKFDDIPEVWWKSLLFIENRELLDQHASTKNIVIEWDRLLLAAGKRMGNAVTKQVGVHLSSPGGSGLAVQNEKILHSPNARTEGIGEKFKQINTASVRYYAHKDPKQIVLEYFALVPLSSTPKDGEVTGFAEGMQIWFGRDFKTVKEILDKPEAKLSPAELKLKAQVYREALSVVMSVKKPSEYFIGPSIKKHNAIISKEDRRRLGHEALETRIDIHLPLLVKAGVISDRFAKLVAAERLQFADQSKRQEPPNPSPHKFVNNLRIGAQQTMNLPSLYDLDHRDVTAKTTLDGELNKATEAMLHKITDSAFAKANGLTGGRDLLDESGTKYVKASFALYEIMPDGRVVARVLTDNLGDDPLNLNSGGKLELGSTAKLRWGLAQYEMFIGELFDKYSTKTEAELRDRLAKVSKNDNLTQWALTYLLDPATDKASFQAMLDASMERTYSGALGGTKVQNFDSKENSWNVSVSKNFHHSVNAAFIRIMRDNVNHAIYEKMGLNPDFYDNPNDPRRDSYLNDFAAQEGSIFLSRLLKDQTGKSPAEVEAYLVSKSKSRSPEQMAALFRYLHPKDSVEAMKAFIIKNAAPQEIQKLEARNVPTKASKVRPAKEDIFVTLYRNFAPGAYDQPARERFNKRTGTVKKYEATHDLNERAYKIFQRNLHPLALWLAKYRMDHPEAKWQELNTAAATADTSGGKSAYRQAYSWLFNPNKTKAQNRSLMSIVRYKAFNDVLLPQQQLWGFPFNKVVDDERTVLGSSGDTPKALATLMGIIQNDGILKKPDIFWGINRAENTIYHRAAEKMPEQGVRVMRPEIARSLRKELQGVVEEGTGVRLKNIFKMADGTIIPNGGKTGSGNNVVRSGNGQIMDVKNRTATWTYIIGDRFYGTTLLYVDGKPLVDPVSRKTFNPAAKSHFTSATAVITTKLLFATPEFQKFLAREIGAVPLPAGKPAVPKPTASSTVASASTPPKPEQPGAIAAGMQTIPAEAAAVKAAIRAIDNETLSALPLPVIPAPKTLVPATASVTAASAPAKIEDTEKTAEPAQKAASTPKSTASAPKAAASSPKAAASSPKSPASALKAAAQPKQAPAVKPAASAPKIKEPAPANSNTPETIPDVAAPASEKSVRKSTRTRVAKVTAKKAPSLG